MVTDWHYAALAMLPLILWVDWWRYRSPLQALWTPKLRTWWAMAGSSAATFVYQDLGFYIAICLIAGAITLSYQMTAWQRFIGWIFMAMAGFNIGHMIGDFTGVHIFSSTAHRLDALWQTQYLLGWAMLAALFVWTGHHGIRRFRNSRDPVFRDTADGVSVAVEPET